MHFVTTSDGSKTLYNPTVGEHYHSRHGAVQESRHVFLQSGLQHYLNLHPVTEINVLEVGFGTGLNFLLSADYCAQNNIRLNYTGIEAYPLTVDILRETGYNNYINADLWQNFISSYPHSFNHEVTSSESCKLEVAHCRLMDFTSEKQFHIIYFDAFAALHQPEMWTTEALHQVCRYLIPGGIFVTYAITGNLKRSMKTLGFSIEKAPGAPGKREMLRATKL
ncbi:tRNA (5-methylaminomethyl-2-thiouridine)(34)-methyltransferase MnmD [Pedobacter sp. BS3]|uniref:tRNA (5-methylaminomethyl-2-thiouridine)(34)-methyltransferase MnmD n=1 Tax=Pedobacter sp. BS3 TaxID=2567937 RepID=UPI0011EE8044|nr:tRNA (5-methylaminomethyl-2-thiouridine)(34)-methyltransferase MnmD [Pedobacter sp. BS3]TZF82598.1 tRNA (5-methylaminomethyl-2-thiouridine)(34)-methyltransferase MnmD [Pedobacter sp. BS3]